MSTILAKQGQLGSPRRTTEGGHLASRVKLIGVSREWCYLANHNEPTVSEWRALYEAAQVFYETKSWEWMYDDDIFGVEDPETGEVVFCCTMGNSEQHFALGGFIGTRGLDGILQILSGAMDEENPDIMFLQNCLMCSFENRTELHKRDRTLIQSLGRKYRERNAWPLFRFHETGYPPWFITSQQCRLLPHVLLQANEVAIRCRREGKDLLEHHTIQSYFVRSCSKKNGDIVWQDSWQKFEPYNPRYPSYTLTDEVLVRRLRALPVDHDLALEADFFYMPQPIQDRERPYYPMVCVLVDHDTGIVFSVETVTDGVKERHQFVDLLCQFVVQRSTRPSQIMVARPDAYALFSHVARQIELPMERVPRLENVL